MDRSEPVPKFALKLSWNVKVPADVSNTIVLLPDPTVAVKVISPLPWVMAPVTSTPAKASRFFTACILSSSRVRTFAELVVS